MDRPTPLLLVLVVACGSSTPVPAAPPSHTPPSSEAVASEAVAFSPPLLSRIALSPTGGCALDDAGIARCWDAFHPPRPLTLPPLTGLAVGWAVCGLDREGAVHCRSESDEPIESVGGTGFVDVAMGCGLREGSVVCRRGVLATSVAEMSLGPGGLCVRTHDGAVRCGPEWGPLVEVAGVRAARRLAGSGTLGCALVPEGVICFGDLGALAPAGAPGPVSVPGLEDAVDLVVGGGTVCARGEDGGWRCVGDDRLGQLGLGTTGMHRSPVPAFAPGDEIALGRGAACWLRAGVVQCAGDGRSGVLGPDAAHAVVAREVLPPAEAERPRDLFALPDATCARSEAHLTCWGTWDGADLSGVLERTRPRVVDAASLGLDGLASGPSVVVASGSTGCVLGESGDLRCNDAAALSAGDVRAVAAGAAGICLLGRDGRVRCPRDSSGSGEPFAGTDAGGEPARATSIAVGDDFACAVRAGGEVVCALATTCSLGWVEEGVFDDGESDDAPEDDVAFSAPVWTEIGLSAVEVVAGTSHLCGRTMSGAMWCFGSTVSAEDMTLPRTLVGADAVSIVSGESFACALVRASGAPDAVHCFGLEVPESGEWDEGGGPVPGLIDGAGQRIERLVAGRGHACVLRSDGAVRCWGDETAGQAGPLRTVRTAPVVLRW